MLKSHIDSVEGHLLEISKVPANSGHSLHKGTPREAFIREFLENHLSEQVAIGTGEVIDANSKPGDSRNQIDIVLYKKNYPKIDFGGGVNGFLAESVVATIEVKSTLDKSAIKQSIGAASNVKNLDRNIVQSFHAGYQPPGILSYVVAYDGPANMSTVYKWITDIHDQKDISLPKLNADLQKRVKIQCPTIDGVFVLGKGFTYFDNVPAGFSNEQVYKNNPDTHWLISNSEEGNLLLLFLFLTQAVSGVSGSWLNPIPYLSDFKVPDLQFGI